MISKEAYDKLLEDIRMRMAAKRTFLDVPMYQKRSIDELKFLSKLLKDIDTEDSLRTADYIDRLVIKGETGTYKIGD